jgi:hypothetical protein
MKKIYTMAAVGFCLASLVGCSSSNQSASASNSSSQPTQQATQQTSQPSSDNGQANHKGQGPYENQELLSLLKIDSNTLQSDLKAGKSLADIAQEKGVQDQQVIDLLVKQSAQKADEAVKSGKLTQDKADQMKGKEQDRIKQEVERKGGFGGNGQGNQQHRQKHDQKSADSNSDSK